MEFEGFRQDELDQLEALLNSEVCEESDDEEYYVEIHIYTHCALSVSFCVLHLNGPFANKKLFSQYMFIHTHNSQHSR